MAKKKGTIAAPLLYTLLGIIIGATISSFFLTPQLPKEVPQELEYQTCFTPRQKCLPFLLSKLASAKISIRVQSYSFTSVLIADALIAMHQQGIQITVIADKSQVKAQSSQLRNLLKAGIPVFIDYKPAIAHNKVIILDETSLFTGSYNWTKAAENRNAENLIFLKGQSITHAYLQNFSDRLKEARPLSFNRTPVEK
jgi:phosphatidylserine/phosphatidylglycerophosphate/cardiolipin synthase-like enzyme